MFANLGVGHSCKLVLCFDIDLQLLLRRFGNAEEKKKQFNRSGFVKSTRAPVTAWRLDTN